MKIYTWYTELGSPKTGLSPTIDVWESDGTQVVTAQAMTEVTDGFYSYDFTTYDEAEDYLIKTDAGEDLDGADRHNFASNSLTALPTTTEIADAVWDEPLSGHTTAGTAGKAISDMESKIIDILGLTQSNTIIDTTVYDSSNNLTSGRIRIFPTSSDVTNETNVISTFTITASYDSNGLLEEYKVVKN